MPRNVAALGFKNPSASEKFRHEKTYSQEGKNSEVRYVQPVETVTEKSATSSKKRQEKNVQSGGEMQ